MNEFKGAPGPWTLSKSAEVDGYREVYIHSDLHTRLASVIWAMDSDVLSGHASEACEANARLIAAAPALLSFVLHVKKCLDQAGEYCPVARDHIVSVLYDALGNIE